MSNKDALKRILKWNNIFNTTKWAPLGNEVAEGPKSKFTNFSLQHIMDKYNFLPSMLLQKEFLMPFCVKNPEIVEDAFLNHPEYNYYVESDNVVPTKELHECLKQPEKLDH